MGSDKGGSADQSGMMQAMASAQAAEKAYALGEQQLQWTKDVWNQEQPLMEASTKQQMALAAEQQKNLEQMTAEAQQQWQTYEDTYLPLEKQFAGQAATWASPGNQALVRGQAMGDVGEAGMAGVNTAAETLRGYGINPSSPRYASLYTSEQPMIGAAEAAAGTTAGQNLKLQQLGLEGAAINTGRGMVNTTGSLTQAGTGAGSAGSGSAASAAGTAQQNLATGSTAMTNPTAWFNAGANNMNSYVNAVNGYNQTEADYAQANASEMGGFGSALGSVLGMAMFKSDERDKTDIKHEGTASSGIPIYSYRYKEDPKTYPKVVGPMAQDVAKIAPDAVSALPGRGMMAINIDKLRSTIGYEGGGPADPQFTPMQGAGPSGRPGIPGMPSSPFGATTGGTVPVHASPSGGVATDDVPAMLTANEFVIPKDVAMWVGHKALVGHIDKARKEQEAFSQRGDIGGEPVQGAIPQSPNFVSRPAA